MGYKCFVPGLKTGYTNDIKKRKKRRENKIELVSCFTGDQTQDVLWCQQQLEYIFNFILIMGGCTAINCRNHSRKGHRMFQFPKDAERKKKWLINMRRVSWIPGKTSQLCSEHFEDSEFEQNRADGWKKLKQTAVPTKFDIPNAPVKMTTKRVKGFGNPTKPRSVLDVHLQDVHQNDVQKECQGAEIAALKKKLVDMEAKLKMNNAEKEGLFRRVLSLEQDLAKKEAHLNLNNTEKADLVRRVRTLEQELGKKEAKLKFNYTEKEDLVKQVTTLKQELVKKEAKLKLMTQLLNSDGSSLCSDVSISDVSSSDDDMVNESNEDALDINSLPDDIILEIFGYLKQNQLGPIARVCRRWNVLTNSPVLWKKVNVKISSYHGLQTTVAKSIIHKLPSCVISIRLDFAKHENWIGTLDFAELSLILQEKCPHLEELILIHCVLSNCLPSVIDLCTQYLQDIKKLIFHLSRFPAYCSASDCFGVSKIEVLELLGCEFDCFNEPPFVKMPHLKQLHLFASNVDESWFEDDTSFLDLLDLGATSITAKLFPAIQNHGLNLKELCLCWVDLQDHDLNFNNSVFPHLETICLCLTYVTCEGVISLLQSCPSLQNVYVSEYVAQSFAAHRFIVNNRSKLEIVKTITSRFHHNTIHKHNVFYLHN